LSRAAPSSSSAPFSSFQFLKLPSSNALLCTCYLLPFPVPVFARQRRREGRRARKKEEERTTIKTAFSLFIILLGFPTNVFFFFFFSLLFHPSSSLIIILVLLQPFPPHISLRYFLSVFNDYIMSAVAAKEKAKINQKECKPRDPQRFAILIE